MAATRGNVVVRTRSQASTITGLSCMVKATPEGWFSSLCRLFPFLALQALAYQGLEELRGKTRLVELLDRKSNLIPRK